MPELDGTEAEARAILGTFTFGPGVEDSIVDSIDEAMDTIRDRVEAALRAHTAERDSARDSFQAEHRMHVETLRVSEVVRQERDRLAERVTAVEEAARDVVSDYAVTVINGERFLDCLWTDENAGRREDEHVLALIDVLALQAGTRGEETS